MPDTEGEWLPGRRGNDQGRVLGYHRRRDDDDFDHTRRNQGTRRHCSVSSWVRNPRCRGVVEDCVSSTRWRGGRSRAGHQVRTQVWKVKAVNEAKKKKKVSFADPIATELKPPKRAQPDDSILLIKAGELGNEHTSSIIKDLTLMETAKIQQTLSATLRLMERTLTATKEDLVLVIDYKLTYPSGTATAVLINGFHTPRGEENAKKQLRGFLRCFAMSLLWSFFQWFYTGGEGCGFLQFPTFGLKAWKQTFFFDFSLTYVGAGMICSHLVNLSSLFGAILSWGVLWPLISKQKGNWYPADVPESSMTSLFGYKSFLCIALIMGDGLYHFTKVMVITVNSLHERFKNKHIKKVKNEDTLAIDDMKHDEVFNRDYIPNWVAYTGYALLSIIAIIVIPVMFRQVKWYYVVVAYVLAPVLGFSNAYGTGLTDINMSYNYGKIALFIFAAWGGKDNGVIAGLVGCGIVKQLVQVSAELMHDFKTAHLTLTSPRSMLVGQVIGTAMGCIISPLTFMLFFKAFDDIGNPDGYWKAPYALIFRNMAILGVQGVSALPTHCLELSAGFFAFAVATNVARDLLMPRSRYRRYVPLPTAMAVPFLVGANFAVDMCVGSLVVFAWHKMNSMEAELLVPAVASGFICGDGIWTFPSSLLSLAKVKPPICMRFSPGS